MDLFEKFEINKLKSVENVFGGVMVTDRVKDHYTTSLDDCRIDDSGSGECDYTDCAFDIPVALR